MPVRIKKYDCGIVTVSTVGKTPKPTKALENGLKKKYYSIKWRHYRIIASSLVNQWNSRENLLTFWTLTMDCPLSEKMTNYSLSKFLENLRKNYGLVSYVWVLEKQGNGNPHYHCIFDMPFQDIKTMNQVWVETLKRGCVDYVSRHDAKLLGTKPGDEKPFAVEWVNSRLFKNSDKTAVRLPPAPAKGSKYRSEVSSLDGLTRYLCKYLVKNIKNKVKFEAKCYGISANIQAQAVDIDLEDLNEMHENYQLVNKYISEYNSIFVFDVHSTKNQP